MNRQPLTVAVVGATGVVGRTMIQILNEREFPVGELRLLASGRSAGRSVCVDGRTLEIGEAVPEAFDGVDIALFSAGADVSRDLAPAAVARGATVIDNSSAWRMDPTVPLVVSQVNPDDLEGHPGIVANPNCSTMQLAPVLMALRDTVGIERVVVDTYQSVSGTGADALAELEGQIRAHVAGEPKTRVGLPAPDRVQRPARDRRLPAQRLHQGGMEGRQREPQDPRACPDLRISCTAVRIPVFVSHSEAVHVETRDPITPERARELFAAVPGVVVQDDPGDARLPARDRGRRSRRDLRRPGPARRVDRRTTAALPSGSSPTTCARARRRTPSRLAEVLVERGWVKPAAARGASRTVPRASSRPRRDRPRAPAGARGDRRRGPGLHELPVARDADQGRPGEGDPETEVVFVGEGPGFNEDRRAGRSSAAPATCW